MKMLPQWMHKGNDVIVRISLASCFTPETSSNGSSFSDWSGVCKERHIELRDGLSFQFNFEQSSGPQLSPEKRSIIIPVYHVGLFVEVIEGMINIVSQCCSHADHLGSLMTWRR